MHRLAAAALTGISLLAQDAAGKRPTAPPVLVDTVVATVNDAAIMLSELRTLAAGRIREAEQRLGRRLQPPEITAAFQAELQPLIDKHAMAQAAKTFGVATPEQVEQYFRDEMKREEDEQVRDLGTHQEFSRELQRQGRTWQTYWREQRVEKMYDLAQDFAVGMRMQKQSNLFLTPRMLRDTFRLHRDLFVHGAAANVVVIRFTGNDAEAHAAAAAALWAQEPLAAADLLARIPGASGHITPLGGVEEKSKEALAGEIVDFALAGPQGKVSPPMRIGDGIIVARIVDHREARNGRFDDPEVQLQLRRIAEGKVIEEFRGQALDRALDRTEVWLTKTLR